MLEKQLEYIRSVTDFRPDIAIVLGSGSEVWQMR